MPLLPPLDRVLQTVGEMVPLKLKRGSIRMPTDLSRPVVMVGPGTGIAPFRSMAHQRAHARRSGQPAAPVVVICGHRREQEDFLYGDEWRQLHADGHVRELVTAFSRDAASKVYVQHRMVEPAVATLLWRLLHDEGGSFLLAGNSQRMPKDVRAALLQVATTQGGLDKKQADEFLAGLQRTARFQMETWF